MLGNKKAQIGETMTWVVATLVIVVILVLSIYASLFLAKTKGLRNEELDVGSLDEKYVVGSSMVITVPVDDFLEVKTSLAHELANNQNKELIDGLLEEANE